MQLELFRPILKPDLISQDSVSHWSYMLATDGKRWPYLAPYYKAMIEFNHRRLALGWDNAGPQPKHPHDDEDDDLGAPLPAVVLPTLGYLSKPCGEWHLYCKGWTGFNAVLPISWSY
jgi:hypothetical protein